MWSWAQWPLYGKGQDKEKEETEKQPDMAEGQRQPRVTGYYQRNRSEEPSAKASGTIGTAKPPGGARRDGGSPHSQQKVEDAELEEDWENVEHEDLKKLQTGQSGKSSSSQVTPAMQEPIRECPPASSGPASTLSTDSERYSTPFSSLSESVSEHRGLVQTDSGLLLRLQQENAAKDGTINKLERNVNQLKKRLKYAEQLEEQNLRLTTDESKHEEENQILRREVDALKRKASLSRPLTRSYAHEQKVQVEGRYEQQYHEEVEENTRLRGMISQLQKEIQGQEEGPTRIDEVDDPGLNVELRRKEQHVRTLQAQVESLQQHSKAQSKHILQLKQELEAVKVTGEEFDASWRGMVDQLEEENRKLTLDVGGFRRDKKFLEKSLEAAMARNEDLEPLAQRLQTELEDVIQKEESARKQLESIGGSSRKAFQKCQELEADNKKLSEQMTKLSGFTADSNTLANELKSQIRRLEEEKHSLQNEVQMARTAAQVYSEDFASERRDREAAHSKFADLQERYTYDVGELKAQLAQMEEDLLHHKDILAEVEQVNQRREKEMRSVLEEASNNQTEVQAKTSQVKQYKKQVDSLKDQVAELQRHNENLIQEMDRVMTELEKLKTGKPKKKPSDADDPSKLAELEGRNKDLEGRNKQLLKERDKLFREVEKTNKELAQAKTKAEAEKTKKDGKKEAKKKHSDKGVTSPEPTEVSKALEDNIARKELQYEELSEKYDALQVEFRECQRINKHLKSLWERGPENLLLAQSRESSQSPLTSPVVDMPRASHPNPRQQPPRILEEDEEIEQEKIKQTLNLQFHKQRQSFQSMEEQTSTAGAGTLPGQAIIKANAPPVQYAHGHPPPPEYYHENPHGSGFEAQLNVRSGTDIGPAAVQLHDQPPPPLPRPPKPSPTPPTMSPCDSEIHQLPSPHAGGPVAGGPVAGRPLAGGLQPKPPYSQQIPRNSSQLGAPGIAPQDRRTYPQTPPAHHWNESHPRSSQYPPQYGTEMPPQKPIAKQCSVGGEIEQRTLVPLGQQGDRLQGGSGRTQSSHQQRLRSPQEDQYQTGQHSLSAPLPVAGPVGSEIQQNTDQCEAHESYEGGNLDQNLDSVIHAQAETVKTEVGDESSRRLTMRHVPYDPNLTCPMCNKRFRIGEIQKYRAHVKMQCLGSQEGISDV